jgi:hypothetical protein
MEEGTWIHILPWFLLEEGTPDDSQLSLTLLEAGISNYRIAWHFTEERH